jgi:hypothetical protein
MRARAPTRTAGVSLEATVALSQFARMVRLRWARTVARPNYVKYCLSRTHVCARNPIRETAPTTMPLNICTTAGGTSPITGNPGLDSAFF